MTEPVLRLLKSLVKQIKRIASAVGHAGVLCQQPACVEEYVVEHLLLYHGLVGGYSQEQPEFGDVRAEIEQAVVRHNGIGLCLALRLSPLRWEEHLQPIWSSVDRTKLLALLLPESDDPGVNPLLHEDWMVRANTANALAFLNEESGTSGQAPEAAGHSCEALTNKLAAALRACTEEPYKPAFCHIAYALGRLRTQRAREALLGYLHHSESWFRVDAVRALALFPRELVEEDLLKALLSYHPMVDYMSVAIARRFSVVDLLARTSGESREGVFELILGLLQAASQTFSNSLNAEALLFDCWEPLINDRNPSAGYRQIRATLQLSEFMGASDMDPCTSSQARTFAAASSSLHSREVIEERVVAYRRFLDSLDLGSSIRKRLSEAQIESVDAEGELRHAILLCGEMKIKEDAGALIQLLEPCFVRRDEVIQALGDIGDLAAVPALTGMAGKLVDVRRRGEQPLSRYPVIEQNPPHAKSYFLILKALGAMPCAGSLDFLLAACDDLAADKREQALRSLIRVAACPELLGSKRAAVVACVGGRLEDPSNQVRLEAVNGASCLGLRELLPRMKKARILAVLPAQSPIREN